MGHHQQGAGARLLRVVVVALIMGGWLLNALHGTLLPGFDRATLARIDWTFLPWLVTVVLLDVGPQPRWATKWAWFWMMGAGPMAVVFLMIEPVPVWQSEALAARPWRLTGGRAFLLTLAAGLVYLAVQGLVTMSGSPGPFGY